jgi:hypothetical protein
MTLPTRPRAPWYSTGTRRLALVRVGLPTLLACVIAVGPAVAARTPSRVPPQAAAVLTQMATAARRALDPPGGGHEGHHGDGTGERSGHGR